MLSMSGKTSLALALYSSLVLMSIMQNFSCHICLAQNTLVILKLIYAGHKKCIIPLL